LDHRWSRDILRLGEGDFVGVSLGWRFERPSRVNSWVLRVTSCRVKTHSSGRIFNFLPNSFYTFRVKGGHIRLVRIHRLNKHALNFRGSITSFLRRGELNKVIRGREELLGVSRFVFRGGRGEIGACRSFSSARRRYKHVIGARIFRPFCGGRERAFRRLRRRTRGAKMNVARSFGGCNFILVDLELAEGREFRVVGSCGGLLARNGGSRTIIRARGRLHFHIGSFDRGTRRRACNLSPGGG
jgi:hypothetical protein